MGAPRNLAMTRTPWYLYPPAALIPVIESAKPLAGLSTKPQEARVGGGDGKAGDEGRNENPILCHPLVRTTHFWTP